MRPAAERNTRSSVAVVVPDTTNRYVPGRIHREVGRERRAAVTASFCVRDAVGCDSEMDNRIVALVGHVQVEMVARDRKSHGRRPTRVNTLSSRPQGARLRIDREACDLAIGARSPFADPLSAR